MVSEVGEKLSNAASKASKFVDDHRPRVMAYDAGTYKNKNGGYHQATGFSVCPGCDM